MPLFLRAGAIALALSSAASPQRPVLDVAETKTLPSPFGASFAVVPRIDCETVRGSGVRLSDNLVITAAHVSNKGEKCSAFGAPMRQIRVESNRDVAFLEGDMGEGFRAIYSCAGIREGERYLVMGYPFGQSPDVEMMTGTSKRMNGGYVLMKGRTYHGVSGGGVFEESTGALVAVVNALAKDVNYTWVTPLSETYLCSNA